MRSRSKCIDLEKLNRNEELATLIPRLMMACNDISLSHVCHATYLARHEDENRSKDRSINAGACMYFVRLQIGHIQEGLRIIKEIQDNPTLVSQVEKLGTEGREAFERLCSCVDGKDTKWKKYFAPIRNNLSFHYNHEKGSELIRGALRDLVEKKKQDNSIITVGDIKQMRFNLADEIVDTIVCRNICEIPYDVDLREDKQQLYAILDYGSNIGESFLAFAAEFVYAVAGN